MSETGSIRPRVRQNAETDPSLVGDPSCAGRSSVRSRGNSYGRRHRPRRTGTPRRARDKHLCGSSQVHRTFARSLLHPLRSTPAAAGPSARRSRAGCRRRTPTSGGLFLRTRTTRLPCVFHDRIVGPSRSPLASKPDSTNKHHHEHHRCRSTRRRALRQQSRASGHAGRRGGTLTRSVGCDSALA